MLIPKLNTQPGGILITIGRMFIPIIGLVLARRVVGRVALYGNCSVESNHLDANTKAFVTDCDSLRYCSLEGTCQPRLCRRDEYILSSLLDSAAPVPPLCTPGTFCPDDASGCIPLVEEGGKCQLNRDDECQAPPPGLVPVVPSAWDLEEGEGSICLLGTCVYANATLGTTCTTESTTYIGYDVSGMSFSNIVTRDDCVEGQGYCDITSSVCLALKPLKAVCKEDRECQTFNCNGQGVCTEPPEKAVKVAKWVYTLIGLGIAAAMAGILAILILMHRRAQASKRIMLEDYYKEQTAYRNSILSFASALSRGSKKDKENMMRSLSDLSDTTLVDDQGWPASKRLEGSWREPF